MTLIVDRKKTKRKPSLLLYTQAQTQDERKINVNERKQNENREAKHEK